MIKIDGNEFQVLEVGTNFDWLELRCTHDMIIHGDQYHEAGEVLTYFVHDDDCVEVM